MYVDLTNAMPDHVFVICIPHEIESVQVLKRTAHHRIIDISISVFNPLCRPFMQLTTG